MPVTSVMSLVEKKERKEDYLSYFGRTLLNSQTK